MKNSLADNEISETVLGTFEIFKNLTGSALNSVTQAMKVRQYVVGNYIISSNQTTTDVFFIINGQVRVCAYASNGKQIHFEDLAPGQMFGELAAIDGGERSSDCIAVQDSYLAYLPQDDFLKIIETHPEVLRAVLKCLTFTVRRLSQRIYEFSACSVKQRIRFELLRLASDENSTEGSVVISSPPTHTDIALRVSTHREAVSREITRLQAKGIVTWGKGTYIVHDMGELLDLASSDEV